MKEYHILSWGGGTQSTALMLKMLREGKHIDYIMFADTLAEHKMTYEQIYKVQKYVEKKYEREIIITSKTEEVLEDEVIEEMIKNGFKYRNSKYDHLMQSLRLYFKGIIDHINVMPFFTRNKNTGSIGKTPFKQCTFEYKINQILRELRKILGLKRFNKKHHHININIGYSWDELQRFKDSDKSYVKNHAPLIDEYITRKRTLKMVEKEMGFIPRSSVCNCCFANDFIRVYDTYKNDSEGWLELIDLDNLMHNKPENHPLKDDVFMYRWQAELNMRLKDIDMDKLKKEYDEMPKTEKQSIFDLEQEWGCNEGCFL